MKFVRISKSQVIALIKSTGTSIEIDDAFSIMSIIWKKYGYYLVQKKIIGLLDSNDRVSIIFRILKSYSPKVSLKLIKNIRNELRGVSGNLYSNITSYGKLLNDLQKEDVIKSLHSLDVGTPIVSQQIHDTDLGIKIDAKQYIYKRTLEQDVDILLR